MALTQVEAAKLTQDLMLRGVIEVIVKDSSILQMLPFMEVVGSGVTYNREKTLPAAAFYDPGDTWTEATPDFTQVTAALKIIGGDADVDNFLQQTYANPNDLEATVIESRAKSVAHKFSDAFYNGDSSVDTKSFDGLARAVPGVFDNPAWPTMIIGNGPPGRRSLTVPGFALPPFVAAAPRFGESDTTRCPSR